MDTLFQFTAYVTSDNTAIVEMTDGSTGETMRLAQKQNVTDNVEALTWAAQMVRMQLDEIG